MSFTIGELIKSYRKSRRISQFDLEITTGLGLGSISKIELGKILPNNGMICRIIKALGLNTTEALKLYGIDPKKDERFTKSIRFIEAQKNLKDTLQSSVNQIAKELDIIGSAIYTIDESQLIFMTASEKWFSKKMVALTDHYNNRIKYEISENSENSLVKALVKKTLVTETSMYNCTKPQMQRAISDLIQNIIGIKEIAVLPILVRQDKAIGVCTIALNQNQSLEHNLPYFYLFTHLTSPLIYRWLRD